jgi:hypothetical protein
MRTSQRVSVHHRGIRASPPRNPCTEGCVHHACTPQESEQYIGGGIPHPAHIKSGRVVFDSERERVGQGFALPCRAMACSAVLCQPVLGYAMPYRVGLCHGLVGIGTVEGKYCCRGPSHLRGEAAWIWSRESSVAPRRDLPCPVLPCHGLPSSGLVLSNLAFSCRAMCRGYMSWAETAGLGKAA